MKRSDESTAEWPMTTHTETQQGYVPHLLMTINGQSFLAPVKVVPTRQSDKTPHAKVSDDGRHHVYALPGGKEVLA